MRAKLLIAMLGVICFVAVLFFIQTGFPLGRTGVPIKELASELTSVEWAKPEPGPESKEEDKDGKKPDQPGEAMEFYIAQRGGKPVDYSFLANVAQELKNRPKAKALGDNVIWESLGPGNVGGRTRTFLIDPNTPSTMYTAGVAGGIWKSTDSGTSWNALDDFLTSLAIVTLVFEGQGGAFEDTSVIYAGTGEGFFNADAVRGAGVFVSTDSGATWTQLPATANSDFYYVNKLAASPNDPNVLYAATRTGIWKTANAGASWTNVLANTGSGGTNNTVAFGSAGMMDVAVRTDLSPDVVLAANGSFSTDGVYRSLDAGATWTRVLTDASMRRVSLAIAPSNQEVMYAHATNTSYGTLNVYRSADGGATWTPQQAGTFTPNVLGGQGWYDNIVAVSPTNPDEIYLGGVYLYRSTNGGATVSSIGSGYILLPPHPDNHAIVFDPDWNGTSNQEMFVGSDGGIAWTANASSGNPPSWTSLNNGYGVTQFYHGRPLPPGYDGYFGGTQDNGTLMGTDATGPNGWTLVNGGDGVYVSYDPANPNNMFYGTQNLSLYRELQSVGFGQAILNGVTGSALFINPHTVDPSNGDIVWYGTSNGPWRTTNAVSAATGGAVTWIDAGQSFGTPTAWAVDPNDSNKVYVGVSGGVYKNTAALSANSSTVWQNITPPNSGYVSWLRIDPNDLTGETVYATRSFFSTGNVSKSTNGGSSWTDIHGNLPAIPVHSIEVLPGFPSTLYAGTELGVFVTTDAGINWNPMNTPGFANAVVEALEFQDEDTLYAFTHGRGAFRAIRNPSTDDLYVSPSTSFDSGGPAGGPFTPSTKDYTLTNLGSSSINWTAASDSTWFSVSSSGGTLAPSQATVVTVSVNAAANSLTQGDYAGTVVFTNTTSAVAQQREALLGIAASGVFAQFSFDTDPGWTTEGGWAFGQPQGNGGDPASGHTGSNVYGYNLAGQYPDNLPATNLTTSAINCTGQTSVHLKFWKWLGIESSTYDHASVLVSNNGTSWTTVWNHTTGTFSDVAWSQQDFDISAVADNQPTVYIRWVMGSTDFSVTYSGWNIDDVELTGLVSQGTVMRSSVWADFTYAGTETGSQAEPYNTLAEGIDHLYPGGNLYCTGSTSETTTITKSMLLQSSGGTVLIGQ